MTLAKDSIAKDSIVELHFTLKNGAGEVLDSSEGQEPLLYLHGHQQMLPALEAQLNGKKQGDKLDTVIEAKDGYGTREEELLMEVPITEFGESPELTVGMQFVAQGVEGAQDRLATIKALNGDMVTVDMNHPLADVDLHFDVEVFSTREATAEEISHGHAHGPNGHHHHEEEAPQEEGCGSGCGCSH